MGLSLAQMREHIYLFFELDTDDVSHQLIDRWATEGFNKISRYRPNWPFYMQANTLTLTAGTTEYSDADAGDLRSVESVVGPDGPVGIIGYRDGLAKYRHTDGTFDSGRPHEYSRFGTSWYFWPESDDAHVVDILGYRDPQPFGLQAGSEPDLPSDLHDVLLMWVKYRTYMHQDDTELGEIERFNFEETLVAYAEDLTATDADYPVILGGGPMNSDRRSRNSALDFSPSDWD